MRESDKPKMHCPKCGAEMEEDPDGYWCPKCEEYWDRYDLEEAWEEEY